MERKDERYGKLEVRFKKSEARTDEGKSIQEGGGARRHDEVKWQVLRE